MISLTQSHRELRNQLLLKMTLFRGPTEDRLLQNACLICVLKKKDNDASKKTGTGAGRIVKTKVNFKNLCCI